MAKRRPARDAIPAFIEEWVHTNSFPIVMIGEKNAVISSNDAFTKLLQQTKMDGIPFVRQLLSTPAEPINRAQELVRVLEVHQCVVKRISLSGGQHYVFHGVQLDMQEAPRLCCILMPGMDPSQTYLQGILNTIATFVLEFDSRGNIRYINDQLFFHLGYQSPEREALRWMTAIQPSFSEAGFARHAKKVERDGVSNFRTVFVTKGGEEINLEAAIVQNQLPGDSTYLMTARDITLRLAHEESLQEELQRTNQEKLAVEQENVRLRSEAEQLLVTSGLVYRSAAFQKIVNRIHQIAPTTAPVLITGETGTGKRLIAQTIHRLSRRAEHPFATVDCRSLPPELIESELFGYPPGAFTGTYRDRPGHFEAAHGGTIFLNAIEELPLTLQSRLLRVLETGSFTPVGKLESQRMDVRILCATEHDLENIVGRREIRADLYHLLNSFVIKSPPLRDRKNDIGPLVNYFIQGFNKEYGREMSGPDKTTLQRLRAYDFPGNIAEQKNGADGLRCFAQRSRADYPSRSYGPAY